MFSRPHTHTINSGPPSTHAALVSPFYLGCFLPCAGLICFLVLGTAQSSSPTALTAPSYVAAAAPSKEPPAIHTPIVAAVGVICSFESAPSLSTLAPNPLCAAPPRPSARTSCSPAPSVSPPLLPVGGW
ncbi:hypothetical protein PAHAL_3G431500 [Panicum hallii]|uniref:Uncharacterized protein n=1 Tax=Panicum hallii TaxID=206008 RepID=A0A2S3HE18_9POAL|nr:hypothetical protein PAHAL_3G431500 [Panicum hallii]